MLMNDIMERTQFHIVPFASEMKRKRTVSRFQGLLEKQEALKNTAFP